MHESLVARMSGLPHENLCDTGGRTRPRLAGRVLSTRRYGSELNEETTRWTLEAIGSARRRPMHREGNHPTVSIRGDERWGVRRERGGTTDIGASRGNRFVVGIGRRSGVIVMPVSRLMIIRVMCYGDNVAVHPVTCCSSVMVMARGRSRQRRERLPRQEQYQQRYKKIAYVYPHEESIALGASASPSQSGNKRHHT